MSVTESKLKEGVLTFGPKAAPTLTVSCQATNVTLEPAFEEVGEALEVLCGDTLAASERTMWVLKFTGVQDWTAKTGFTNFAYDHDGEELDFTWTPNKTGPTWSGKVKVKAVILGGAVNTRNTSDAEWPCNGKPLRTDAAAPETPAADAPQAETPAAEPAPEPAPAPVKK